ncbi:MULTISPECIES: HDOD domain-containing protein [unclassified Fusibacter]|uniref:HDOD domain-containing protein n=1 Tax=unclassified Fusibacter TaxID=2624464 RepID=UPI001010847D|nr:MULTISPECIES: HDOD domain-containing protein [unclassified Fusibacter]MCK8061391.1 response regulator [Fusibacter sp. A2]NPE23566.1 HDOD domain-containing protein [Fusibacter sp. A1]RXV58976.1 HDOD domain-containing protein [Fusibacter sp. A1]
MKKNILFVDDENQILRALKRLFHNSEYETFFMESGLDALKLLDQQSIDLLITDLRMPQMSGVELLKEVKKKHPGVLRVALSGYTDSKKIFSAIEENLAKMYLFKPWDNDEIFNIVRNLFALEEKLSDRTLLNAINSLDELPTVPKLFTDISKMIQDELGIEVIAAKIEEDPAIASRILRVANSAFYGAKTGSIMQAIMFIGLLNVKNIVLSNAVFSSTAGIYSMEKLSKHAGLTNRLVNQLYEIIYDKKMPMINSSVGLLHSIGIVMMLTKFENQYIEVIEHANKSDDDICQIESKILGHTHEQLGGYLLNWWELPYPLVEAAMHYRNPLFEEVVHKDITSLVHVASHTAWSMMSEKQFQVELRPEVLTYLGINDSVISTLKKRVAKDMKL